MTVITDEVRARQIPGEIVALLPALSRRREAGDAAPVPVPMSTRTLDHLLIVLTTAPLDAPPRDDCRARDYVHLAVAAAFFGVASVAAFAVAELVAHLARYSDEDLRAAFAASEHTQALLDDLDFVCSRRALRDRLAAAMPERAVYWTSAGTTTARAFVAEDDGVSASLVAPRARARWWHFLYARGRAAPGPPAHFCARRYAALGAYRPRTPAHFCTQVRGARMRTPPRRQLRARVHAPRHRGALGARSGACRPRTPAHVRTQVRAHGAHVGTLALPFFQRIFDATSVVSIDEALTRIMAARAAEPGSDVVPYEALEEYARGVPPARTSAHVRTQVPISKALLRRVLH